MKKIIRAGLAGILIFAMAWMFVGCNPSEKPEGSKGENLDKWKSARYKDTVTLKIGMYRAGNYWDMADNEFIDLVYDVLNIKIEAAWDLPWQEHTEKIKLAATTDSLPDAVNLFDYALFQRMISSDMLADLSEAYASADGAYLKEIYETYPDSAPVKAVTYGGKLMAIPSTTFLGQHSMLWIRQDWLDTLNLERPSTLEQVFDVARAFVKNDPDGNGKADTIGIPSNRWVLGANNWFGSIDPIYYALDAYPAKWFQKEDGEVYYGTVTPEMKSAVGVVAAGVKEGFIAPFSDAATEISNGKCGMVFGPWWAPTGILQTIHQKDPEAKWVALSAPVNGKGKFVIPSESPIDMASGIIVVRKGYPHPEAVLRVMNLWSELSAGDEGLREAFKRDEVPNVFCSPLNVQIGKQDLLYEGYLEMLELGKCADPSLLDINDRKTYDLYQQYISAPEAMLPEDWGSIEATMVGRSAVKNDAIVYKPTAISNLTAEMTEAFSSFYSHSLDAIFAIVGGAKQIDAFDQLIADFNAMGGKEVKQMIEEYLKNKG